MKAYKHTGEYCPPDCRYNRVVFNFTVTSAGRQFDRLALMFFDDVEIFRTSTAEPRQDGIMWSYVKDMSSLIALFGQPRKIIFDLGNLVDDTYTGAWHTTLTAILSHCRGSAGACGYHTPGICAQIPGE